jgi:hypothetical protein
MTLSNFVNTKVVSKHNVWIRFLSYDDSHRKSGSLLQGSIDGRHSIVF